MEVLQQAMRRKEDVQSKHSRQVVQQNTALLQDYNALKEEHIALKRDLVRVGRSALAPPPGGRGSSNRSVCARVSVGASVGVAVGVSVGVAVGAGVGAGARARSNVVVEDVLSPAPDVTTKSTAVATPTNSVALLH